MRTRTRLLACVAVGWTIVASGGSVKVDRAFLDALLRLPSESGNAAELARAVNFTYDWLTARGLHCTIETNDAGRLGLLQIKGRRVILLLFR